MPRKTLCFALLGLGLGSPLVSPIGADAENPLEQSKCIVDSTKAVSDAVDASLFMWAAAERCGKPGLETKCAIDATAALHSTFSMINVVVGVVDQCVGLKFANKACVLRVGKLGEHSTALASSSADLAQKCVQKANTTGGMGPVAAPVMCSINLKNTAWNVFAATKSIMRVSKNCDLEPKGCVSNVLEVMAALTAIGQYLAGAVGHCERAVAGKKAGREGGCVQATLAMMEYSTKVAQDGWQMSEVCKVDAQAEQALTALYAKTEKGDKWQLLQLPGSSMLNVALGIVIFASAATGFAAGRFSLTRSRVGQARATAVSLEEGEETDAIE